MIGLRNWLHFQIWGHAPRAPRRKPRRGPERLPEYRSWIRSFPCATCGEGLRIEAAHTGPHGVGQKSSDKSCIPLCSRCHQHGPHSLHRLGPAAFQTIWGIDIAAVVAEFNRQWRQR